MDNTTSTPTYLPTEHDYNELMQFKRLRVDPPARVYVTVDDVLQLTMANPTQTVTVNCSIRIMNTDGQVIPHWYNFPNQAAGATPTAKILRICEGSLLSATVETPGAPYGSVYVMLSVRRGTGANDQTQGDLLLAGYPGSFAQIGFPVSRQDSPTSGAGLQRVATVANPAAGADWSITVPAGAQWLLQSVNAQLVTSATAGTRIPSLVITDNAAHVVFTGVASLSQAASLTYTYSWSPGAVASPAGSTSVSGPLPALLRLQPGWVIKTVTQGIQAGDQWSAISLAIQELAAA